MQKCPIYLYSNLFEVILDLDDNTRINNIMYQRNLHIQKGLKNKVQIQFKNSDQKLINVSTGTFIFSMFNSTNQNRLLRKVIEVTDDGVTTSTRGLGVLSIDEIDTMDIETGFYQFTVASVDADGSYLPTYSNTYYGVSGSIEIRQDSFPTLTSSQQVNTFQPQYDPPGRQWTYWSGNLNAGPQFSSFHTMAIYMTNFKGQILVQGTQDNTPGYFGNFATIQTLTYNGFTGIDYATFQGNFSWVRIKYIPTANPVTGDNSDTTYAGTVDQLLYRY